MHGMPKPSWKPDLIEDVDVIAERLSEYTNRGRAFVVYQCGTAVFSDASAERPDKDYEATLSAVVNQAPDFSVIPMQDGNFLVRFTGPVCGLVLGSFYSEHAGEIRRQIELGGLLPGEQLVDGRASSSPVEHYYVGLFARAKLYRDVEEKSIAIRFVP